MALRAGPRARPGSRNVKTVKPEGPDIERDLKLRDFTGKLRLKAHESKLQVQILELVDNSHHGIVPGVSAIVLWAGHWQLRR